MRHDLIIVGAGAAGLAAAHTARERGLDFLLLEASHRIGGRAYSEQMKPRIAFDLGCHWLHSASLNPLVEIADRLGFHYDKVGRWSPSLYIDGRFAESACRDDLRAWWSRAEEAVGQCARESRDVAIADVVDRDNRWTPFHDYWISLVTSFDSDRVSVVDLSSYRETREDWPIREGYGNLIARHGSDLPVTLNAAVESIDWSRPGVRVATRLGTAEAHAAVVTVSTGILGSGDIRFVPELPAWKRDAIDAVPIGNHNRIAFSFARNVFGDDHPLHVIDMDGEVPMVFRIRPFGDDYVTGVTGGRFADWLERAGVEASLDHVGERLKRLFGHDILDEVVDAKVTAWGTDPWVRGAYSACRPGHAGHRSELAAPVADRLWFAGEATSQEFFSTCHGAWMTGVDTVETIADRLPGRRRTG